MIFQRDQRDDATRSATVEYSLSKLTYEFQGLFSPNSTGFVFTTITFPATSTSPATPAHKTGVGTVDAVSTALDYEYELKNMLTNTYGVTHILVVDPDVLQGDTIQGFGAGTGISFHATLDRILFHEMTHMLTVTTGPVDEQVAVFLENIYYVANASHLLSEDNVPNADSILRYGHSGAAWDGKGSTGVNAFIGMSNPIITGNEAESVTLTASSGVLSIEKTFYDNAHNVNGTAYDHYIELTAKASSGNLLTINSSTPVLTADLTNFEKDLMAASGKISSIINQASSALNLIRAQDSKVASFNISKVTGLGSDAWSENYKLTATESSPNGIDNVINYVGVAIVSGGGLPTQSNIAIDHRGQNVGMMIIGASGYIHSETGQSTSDIIYGGNKGDILVGTSLVGNTIHGGGGADLIITDLGNGMIYGEDGSDVIIASFGQNLYDGGDSASDIDTLYYTNTQNLFSPMGVVVDATTGKATHNGLSGRVEDTFISIENFFGTEAPDAFTGKGLNTFFGLGGNDTFAVRGGDHVNGGGGNDFIDFQDYRDEAGQYTGTVNTHASSYDGGIGFDSVSYQSAAKMTINVITGKATLIDAASGGRVDTFSNIEKFWGGYDGTTFIGDGRGTEFQGNIGDDIFKIKAGDKAVGGSGLDIVSFETMTTGIKMFANGIVKDMAETKTSQISDIDVVIGTKQVDYFDGQGFNAGGYGATVRFAGGWGNDTFNLFDHNAATGGSDADSFYVNASTSPYAQTIRITDFNAQDSLYVKVGGVSYKLTGNELSVSFKQVQTGTDGSYNLIETTTGSSLFSSAPVDRYIGHYDAATNTYVKSEASVNSTTSTTQYDFFEFDQATSTGVLNLKVNGYGAIKIVFDNVTASDFGLKYNTLPTSNRYAGQTFDLTNPTGSYHTTPIDFIDAAYGRKVATTYVDDVKFEVRMADVPMPALHPVTTNTVTGTSGVDAVYGTSAADRMEGQAGADALYGSAGADWINGGDGSDAVSYYNSTSAVDIDLQRDSQLGGFAQGDVLTSIERIAGSGWNDTLLGDDLVNSINGNVGDDILNGRGGADTLTGGGGGDRFVFSSAVEANGDFINGWDAGDSIDLSAIDADQTTLGMQAFTYVGTQAFSNVAGQIRLTNDGVNSFVSGDTNGDGLADFTIKVAGVQSVLTGVTPASNINWNVITGTSALDTISGTSGNDRIDGMAGDDVIYGSLLADEINGGAGNDAMSYYASDAAIDIDLARYSQIGGYAEGDVLIGIERIGGSAFNDIIRGDANGNTLNGNGGDDIIEGREGPDWLIGGTGNDRFVFTPASGEMWGDQITDWNAGDIIDFSAIDANAGLAGDQAFTFVGSAAFTSHAGELRLTNDGTNSFVTGDTNGDGVADFSLLISGVQNFGPSSGWLYL